MIDVNSPTRIWSRAEVLASPCPVPKRPGVYASYFKRLPGCAPGLGCNDHGGLTLLYVGISPSAPPTNGNPPSKQTLFHRIRYHYRGNAEGSTLRLTLGCLLSVELGIELQRVGSGKRLTFGPGETRLSDWMAENAFVAWWECEEPWVVEHRLISELCLPLRPGSIQDRGHRHAAGGALVRRRPEYEKNEFYERSCGR